MTTTLNKVAFFKHDLGQAELDSIAEVFKGPILTTGETVERFEKRFAEYLHINHSLGVTSCTGAMHMSLLALGIGTGDEVITTPLTFIATSTAILEAGAKPVFVDVEPETGNIDAGKIEGAITARTRAILPVHLYGQMCDMKKIRAIADKHNLSIIEDSAHCIEGSRDGIYPGQLSDAVCFSFYATKNLTCGEGGAVATNNTQLYETLKSLRTHGMNKTAADRVKEGYKHWDMTVLGWKYNMDNIQAAILLPQLDRLESKWEQRAVLAAYYKDKLQGVTGISCLATCPEVRHAWHLFPVCIKYNRRDEVIEYLQQHGVSVMVNYRPIHLLTYFSRTFNYKPGDFPATEHIGNSIISLPFYVGMEKRDIDVVIDLLRSILS